MVAAREFLVLLVQEPPRYVDMHAADAVGVVPGQAFESGNVTTESIADGVGKITANLSGGIGQAGGESRRF